MTALPRPHDPRSLGDPAWENGEQAGAPPTDSDASAPPPRRLLWALSLVSAAGLGYEILLMRLFSIVDWHHFAYMIISLALLGYGAGGTFLALARNRLLPRFGPAFAGSALLFGLSATLCFLAARQVPFNALEILWSPVEWGHLAVIYLLLVPPFFFAATAVGLALLHFRHEPGRVYAADLRGAGAGALAIILLLFVLPPLDALAAVSGLAGAGAALGWLSLNLQPRALAMPGLAIGPLLAVGLRLGGVELQPVEYKGLAQALRVVGAEVVEQRSGPLGLLTVVRSPTIPFRHAPGLSLGSPTAVPEQRAVFTDGDGMTVINRWDGSRESLAFLDWVPSALPYHLLPARSKVLVLGAGGGSEVLQGLFHEAVQIDAVELNPRMIDLVARRYADFAGHVYSRPEVRVHEAEARGFVAASPERYDLIQLALLDAFNTSSAGLYGLNESYLYTVEALETYLNHLRPGGFLALTRWVRLPPRDEAKLFATAIAALERSGETDPGRRLLWIRGWQTSTLLVKNGPVDERDIAALRGFSDERSFDPAWYPGLRDEDANVHNLQKQPYLHEAAKALLGPGRGGFIERYKFDLRPATDDRPYFFHFFRWETLSEALALRGAGGLALLDLGYPLLIATLVQAALISALLILAPLLALRTEPGPTPRTRVFVYFLCLGLAFMFTEIAFIQRFILYLAHPLYAVAVVLAGFLLFAGLGSRKAGTIPPGRAAAEVVRAVKAIALLSVLYLVLLPPLFEASPALPGPLKAVAVLGLLAPLAYFMGMPFPLGLSRLAGGSGSLIPWAFGINGCASVIAAILATLLAIHIGQTGLVISALASYGVAAVVMAKPDRR